MTIVLHASTDREDVWGGIKRYIRIVIHPTLEEFIAGATRHTPHQEWDGAIGCFHPSDIREVYNKKTKMWERKESNYAGTMRLWGERVTSDVVVHETVHAAAHIYRLDVSPIANLGQDCFQAEENFAYIVGDLTGTLCRVLHEAKAWSE